MNFVSTATARSIAPPLRMRAAAYIRAVRK
jgi:hypothetical protein